MKLYLSSRRMRFVRQPGRKSDDEGLIPLINVIFLILIFFMIVGHMEAAAPFRVDPPVSRTDARPAPEDLTLLLAADGRVAVGDEVVDDAVFGRVCDPDVVDLGEGDGGGRSRRQSSCRGRRRRSQRRRGGGARGRGGLCRRRRRWDVGWRAGWGGSRAAGSHGEQRQQRRRHDACSYPDVPFAHWGIHHSLLRPAKRATKAREAGRTQRVQRRTTTVETGNLSSGS